MVKLDSSAVDAMKSPMQMKYPKDTFVQLLEGIVLARVDI
jgi:hypothetical protein